LAKPVEPVLTYIGGKLIWGLIRKDMGQDLKNVNALPFSDPGERNALKAILLSKRFGDIFNDEFFKKYCN
jgi:hypothetical protein